MKTSIILGEHEVAKLFVPFRLVRELFEILKSAYHNLDLHYVKQSSAKIVSSDFFIEKNNVPLGYKSFMYMGVAMRFNKQDVFLGDSERPVAVIALPVSNDVLKIGYLLLHNLSLTSIDILMDQGENQKYINHIEMCDPCINGNRFFLHGGTWNSWGGIIKR